MAKKKKESADYTVLTRALKDKGPERLYLLWGEEEYLLGQFREAVRNACFPGGGDDFSYRRLEGLDSLDPLSDAIDAMPCLTDRTLVDVRGVPLNKLREEVVEGLKRLLPDIPEWCTVLFSLPADYEPDGRLSAVKTVKKYAIAVELRAQGASLLKRWIARRFAAEGKEITESTIQYLIFRCGDLMTSLIPEIGKIAAYAKSTTIERSDIDASAHHIPSAYIFDMTEALANRRADEAMRFLSELLSMRDEPPIKILSVIAQQFRKLYCARLAWQQKLGKEYVMETEGVKYDFLAEQLIRGAKAFPEGYLERAVELCALCDYAMKSSSEDDAELLRQLVLQLLTGDNNA